MYICPMQIEFCIQFWATPLSRNYAYIFKPNNYGLFIAPKYILMDRNIYYFRLAPKAAQLAQKYSLTDRNLYYFQLAVQTA